MREQKTAREPGAAPDKPHGGLLKRCIAFASTAILATGLTISGAGPAHAAPSDVSEGLGKFLGGQAAGIDLDDVAEISGAYAENPSGVNPVDANPLGAEVLNALNVDLGSSLQLLGDNGLIQLGAVNQYGEAQDNGDARAASGAVSDQGAISVGGSTEFPSDASITLTPLLSQVGAEGLVSDLSLELGAVSSSIEQIEGGTATSNYDVAGATLNFESPAVGGVYNNLLTTVDGVQGTLDGLSGSISEALAAELNLGIVSAETNVDFVPPNLSETLPDSAVGESSGVTVDLTTGAVNVDLETLLAANPELPNLNEMPANSQLLSGGVVAAISDGITQAITDAVTEVVQNLRDTISSTSLTVTTTLDASIAGSVTVTLDGTLGEILEGSNPDLVTVDSTGAIGAILSALGLDSLDELGTLVLNTVGSLLGDSLTFLTDDLESTVDGITGDLATEVVGPVLDVVNQVVTVLVNVQPGTGDLGEGSSTVRAVQVSLLPSQSLATVNLASSTVRGTLVTPVAPEITVDPAEVPAGGSTTVDGTGFTPVSTATLQLQDADGNAVGDPIEGVATDADGVLTSTELPVPEGTTPGDYTVVATDDASDQTAEAALTVTEPDATIDPSVTVDPAEVPAGDSTTASGTGYTPESTVTVQLTDPNGDPVGDPIEGVATDAEGAFTTDVPVPGDAAPGDYSVVATDDTEGESAEAALTVTEPDATIDPSVSVDPAEVPAGDSTTVDGTGFTPDSTATVQLEDADGNRVGDPIEAPTDENGNFTEELPVPEGTTPGDYTVVVTDDETGESADTPLTVTEPDATIDPSVTVDPTEVAAGGATTVEGTGYTPDSTATVQLTDADGEPVGDPVTADTDADGNFTVQLPVPEGATPGDYTVVATDDETGEAAEAALTVTEPDASIDPALTVDPAEVPAGNSTTVDGTGYTPDSTATVQLTDSDGNVIGEPVAVDTDAEGSFTTDLMVPEGTTPGDYSVVGIDDATGELAEAALAVTEGSGTGETGTETDGTETDGTETDGTETDGTETDGTETDGTETDGTETDGTETDGTETDGTETDGTETDGTETDGTETDGTETDGTETDGTETDGTETDGTETDGTETDGTETDGTETDGTETDGSDEDATDEPSVTVDPDTAAPGDDVTIGGENFDPDTTVTVEITDEGGDVVGTIDGVEVGDDGSFTTDWEVPAGTDPGELTVTATDDQDPSNSDSATLTVTESAGTGTDGLGTDGAGTVDPGAGTDGAGTGGDSDDGLAVTGPTGAIGLGLMALLFLVVGVGVVGYAKERRTG